MVASVAGAASGLTLTVNATSDPDNTVGQCATGGSCSLREAVNQADVDTSDTIVVTAGHYVVSQGELMLSSAMTITGAGASSALIDAQNASRILHVATGSAVSVTGVTLENGNSAGSGGGALVDTGAALTISACTLAGNSAAIGGGGGGIEDEGNVTVQDCTLSSNHAANGGGIQLQDTGSGAALTVTRSTLVANTATSVGGAIDATSGASRTLSISDSTIAANSGMAAGGGLALSASSSPLTIEGDTISGNFSNSGGDVSVTSAAPQFENTIVADGHGPGADCDAPVASAGHNLEDGAGCGFTGPGDQRGLDPKLGTLGDNGGPTQTMALLPGSPAVNAGASRCDPNDQRGVSRPEGGVCDIGAYELAPPVGGFASVLSLTASAATIIVSAGNPDIQPGAISLQYGTTNGYGATTTAQSLPSLVPPVGYTFAISGLQPGRTYHVRAAASNPDGVVDGPDVTFTTLPAPGAVTGSAKPIGATVATLHATIDTGGAAGVVTFEYGTSPTLTGARSKRAQTVPATRAQALVSATVSGLTPGRKYYFRAVATSAPVPVRAVGQIGYFTTLKRITAAVTFAAAASGHAAKVTRLLVPKAPVGATTTVLCSAKGRACPYVRHTTVVRAPRAKCSAKRCPPAKAPATASIDLSRPFHGRSLPFGASVTVRITEAGVVGEADVFTMAKRVKRSGGCLAPGAPRPARTC